MDQYRNVRMLLIVASFACCLASNSCSRSETPPTSVRAERENPLRGYKMGTSLRKRFVDRLVAMEVGRTREAVAKLLGPPFMEDVLQAKGRNTPVRGTMLTYYLDKAEGAGNPSDVFVFLIFDNDGKLAYLHSKNVDELAQRIPKVPVLEYGRDENGKSVEVITEWDEATRSVKVVTKREALK